MNQKKAMEMIFKEGNNWDGGKMGLLQTLFVERLAGAIVAEFEIELEALKCCGNCKDSFSNKNKKVCKTCVRNLYGTKQSDNWSYR